MHPYGWTAVSGFLVANPTAPIFPYHIPKGFVFCYCCRRSWPRTPSCEARRSNRFPSDCGGSGGLLRRRHRPAVPRRCRLARFPRLPARDNIALMPLPPAAPELNSADPSQGSGRLALPRRPGLPRGHPRCVLRRLECLDGQIRGYRVNWNQRLGAG
jgi:hypothetical protein